MLVTELERDEFCTCCILPGVVAASLSLLEAGEVDLGGWLSKFPRLRSMGEEGANPAVVPSLLLLMTCNDAGPTEAEDVPCVLFREMLRMGFE